MSDDEVLLARGIWFQICEAAEEKVISDDDDDDDDDTGDVGVVQALNQLFEKIMALDVDERHLLRMGHGEEELETEKDYSR